MFQLVGKQFMDYVSRKSGKRVRGGKIFVMAPDNRVEGYLTKDIWVSEDIYNKYFKDLPLESFFDLYYDSQGNVVACSVVTKN